MRTIVIFVSVSVLSLAVFGMSAIHKMDGGEHGSCIGSATKGVNCPVDGGVFAFLRFHLGSFKELVTSAPNGLAFAAASLMTVLLLSFATIAAGEKNTRFSQYYFARTLSVLSINPKSTHMHSFVHWLALHEESPSITPGSLTRMRT